MLGIVVKYHFESAQYCIEIIKQEGIATWSLKSFDTTVIMFCKARCTMHWASATGYIKVDSQCMVQRIF